MVLSIFYIFRFFWAFLKGNNHGAFFSLGQTPVQTDTNIYYLDFYSLLMEYNE